MCPDVKFLSIDLYWWMIIIGIIFSFITFRVLSKWVKIKNKIFNFALITSVIAIGAGFGGAVLFQAIYNYISTGVFKAEGLTFSSGLLSAVVIYILFYFVVGHFVFKEKENVYSFNAITTLSFPSIVIAHAFGRIGCLCAGCCYGKHTDAWYGINMLINGTWEKRIPTQLFESIFLFVLFAILLILIIKFKFKYSMSLYLISYGVWRFLIEFVRDDPRGSIGTTAITPSQLVSIIMVVLGIGIIFFKKYVIDKKIPQYQWDK